MERRASDCRPGASQPTSPSCRSGCSSHTAHYNRNSLAVGSAWSPETIIALYCVRWRDGSDKRDRGLDSAGPRIRTPRLHVPGVRQHRADHGLQRTGKREPRCRIGRRYYTAGNCAANWNSSTISGVFGTSF